MSRQDVENRDFTYVQMFADSLVTGHHSHTFLVGTAFKKEARERALAYIKCNGWPVPDPERLHLYPRTYIVDARRLFAMGRHD